MKIPKSFNIFGLRVPIKMKNGIRDDSGQILAGCFNLETNEIWLDKNLSKINGHIERTLFHELFHAAMERQGVNQSNISDEMKEILCELFANLVYEEFQPKKKARKK